MPNTQSKLNSRSTFCLSCHQLCLQKHNLEGTTWYQEKSSLHNTLFFLNTNNCSCNENRRTQNKTKKLQAKFHVYNYPLVSKTNKQKAVWMQSSSAVFPTIFDDFIFFFSTMISEPDRKACTVNELLELSISLCLVLFVDQLSVFVLIIIYYKKKFL